MCWIRWWTNDVGRASKCPKKINIVDINEERISEWNSDKLPIYEPGLDQIVKEARGRNLFFSTNIEEAIVDADIIFYQLTLPRAIWSWCQSGS